MTERLLEIIELYSALLREALAELAQYRAIDEEEKKIKEVEDELYSC